MCLAVVVVSYETTTSVLALIDGLREQSRQMTTEQMPLELSITVVDNSVDDLGLPGRIASLPQPIPNVVIRCLEPMGNIGYGRGNNRGLAEAAARDRPDFFWVLNPDVSLRPDALNGLVLNLSRRDPRHPWFAGTVTYNAGHHSCGLIAFDPLTMHRRDSCVAAQVLYPAGHSIVMSDGFWRQFGGFDPAYFLFFEEIDLACRALAAGVVPDSIAGAAVEHQGGAGTGSALRFAQRPSTTHYNAARSALLFYKRHFPNLVLVPVALKLAHALFLAVRARPHKALYTLAGVWSGIRT